MLLLNVINLAGEVLTHMIIGRSDVIFAPAAFSVVKYISFLLPNPFLCSENIINKILLLYGVLCYYCSEKNVY